MQRDYRVRTGFKAHNFCGGVNLFKFIHMVIESGGDFIGQVSAHLFINDQQVSSADRQNIRLGFIIAFGNYDPDIVRIFIEKLFDFFFFHPQELNRGADDQFLDGRGGCAGQQDGGVHVAVLQREAAVLVT